MSDEREEKGDDKDEKDRARDAARKAVLARRATFVAAALAGVSVACGKETTSPQPCLNVAAPSQTAPQPCLNVASNPPEPSSTTFTEGDSSPLLDASVSDASGAKDAGDAGKTTKIAPPQPTPTVCLKPMPPPQPCLTPKRPQDK